LVNPYLVSSCLIKTQVLSHLLSFKAMVEKKNGMNIKCQRFDKEGKYFSTKSMTINHTKIQHLWPRVEWICHHVLHTWLQDVIVYQDMSRNNVAKLQMIMIILLIHQQSYIFCSSNYEMIFGLSLIMTSHLFSLI